MGMVFSTNDEKRNAYDVGGKAKRKETTRKISTRWVD
jgi:hypothetical protein